MHSRSLCAFLALSLGAASAGAQTLTLTPAGTRCDSAGGTVAIAVAIDYPDTAPAALALHLVLPPGWSHRVTAGPDAPAVAPAEGDTGKLGWACIDVPPKAARFTIVLAYRAGFTAEQTLHALLEVRPAPDRPPVIHQVVFAVP